MRRKFINIAQVVGLPLSGIVLTTLVFFLYFQKIHTSSYRVVFLFTSLILISNFLAMLVSNILIQRTPKS